MAATAALDGATAPGADVPAGTVRTAIGTATIAGATSTAIHVATIGAIEEIAVV